MNGNEGGGVVVVVLARNHQRIVSDMSDLIKRLTEYIEYAEAAKRFADVGFYNELKAEIEALKQDIENSMQINNDLVGEVDELKLRLKRWNHNENQVGTNYTHKKQQAEIERLREALATIRNNTIIWLKGSETGALRAIHVIAREALNNKEE